MIPYPYSSPCILNDSAFVKYGGQIGTTTIDQRLSAYLLAEELMTEHLNSFLLPTIVTGTYFWAGGNPFELDYGHVIRVLNVVVSDVSWSNECSIDTATGCAIVRNAEYGYLDVMAAMSCGGCGNVVGLPPYNVQIAWESGLSTGTSMSPSILSALTIVAQINLNEWDVSLANEGTADIGIQSFSNQGYSENRVKLGRNAFGTSAMSQRAKRLVDKYRCRPGLSFHK